MFGSRTSALLDTGAAENAISFASAVAQTGAAENGISFASAVAQLNTQLNTQLNKTAVEVARERLERIAKLDPRYRGSTTKIKRGLSGMITNFRIPGHRCCRECHLSRIRRRKAASDKKQS